jgi:hypothetical protein
MLTAQGVCRIGSSIGPICSSKRLVSSNGSASGISSQASRGAPMSTVKTASDRRVHRQEPRLGLQQEPVAAGLPHLRDRRSSPRRRSACRCRRRRPPSRRCCRCGRRRRCRTPWRRAGPSAGRSGCAPGSRSRAPLLSRDDMLRPAQVEHGDLVAEPVHLEEPAIGEGRSLSSHVHDDARYMTLTPKKMPPFAIFLP